jgi:hypothetical protein
MKKLFIKNNYSILADYGDLSGINFVQMCVILSNWDKRIFQNGNYIEAEWEDNTTRIKIKYHLITGCFIKILEEEWKLNKTVFVRP